MEGFVYSPFPASPRQRTGLLHTQIPFSAQQRKLIEQGIAVQPRFSRQPGDTEQMVKWREAKANGLLHEHKPQINAAWQEDVYNAPVYKTQAPYYGETPELVGVIPGTGSQRACCRVPVLGWHDGQGVLLTRGARHGQLGRIGRIDGLEVRFLRPPASKLLTPQERKKHMEQKRRQEPQPDSTLLPPLRRPTRPKRRRPASPGRGPGTVSVIVR